MVRGRRHCQPPCEHAGRGGAWDTRRGRLPAKPTHLLLQGRRWLEEVQGLATMHAALTLALACHLKTTQTRVGRGGAAVTRGVGRCRWGQLAGNLRPFRGATRYTIYRQARRTAQQDDTTPQPPHPNRRLVSSPRLSRRSSRRDRTSNPQSAPTSGAGRASSRSRANMVESGLERCAAGSGSWQPWALLGTAEAAFTGLVGQQVKGRGRRTKRPQPPPPPSRLV